ncbi:MAG TPA: arginine deiminase family protein [Candidatus Saccharimonadales bacterium]|nr:arginine deiminase family protein [Candidatus Saccharimonadales bacterium]
MPKKILMSPADHFGIEYEINAWMHQDVQPDNAIARRQWQKVYDIYTKQLGWEVVLADPVKHLPDMVFATDCCLMIGGKILLSNFRYPERQPETVHYKKWFEANGYSSSQMQQAKHRFEGGGDNLVCGGKILAGYGFRSDPEAADELRAYFPQMEVVPLRIVDPFFYHLDTSVAVLDANTIAFYPPALDEASQKRLRDAIPNCIEATLEEAQGFGLNAVSDGKTIITSDESQSLLKKYQDAGFKTIGTPILEFRKSGGGVKCMTLELRG